MVPRYFRVVVCIFFSLSCFGFEKLVLDIPARNQWNFSNGYCGSCSIQMAALLFGSYVSQDRVRKSIGDLEILFGSRMNDALDALSFEYVVWDGGTDIEEYFIWLKEHLHNETPVIVGTKHGDNITNRYHHIILITGYTCENISTYNDDDTLYYNECHKQYTSTQSFLTWQDNTAHNYFDPTRHYGTVVTGIKDSSNETVPVYLSVDNWEEPKPDEPPVTFNATIQIRALEPGKNYILLKYTDHTKVPAEDFCNDTDFIFKKFVAAQDTAEFTDSFLNNETAIYRCVPDNTTGIHPGSTNKTISNDFDVSIVTNTKLAFSISNDAYIEVGLYNCRGQIVASPIQRYICSGNHTVDLGRYNLTSGTYYLEIGMKTGRYIRKIVFLK